MSPLALTRVNLTRPQSSLLRHLTDACGAEKGDVYEMEMTGNESASKWCS